MFKKIALLFSKNKVVLKTTNNEKICTLRFTDKEFDKILLACKLNNETIEEFFNNVIRDAAGQGSSRRHSI